MKITPIAFLFIAGLLAIASTGCVSPRQSEINYLHTALWKHHQQVTVFYGREFENVNIVSDRWVKETVTRLEHLERE